MAPRVTCECGECKKCKHRAYMRSWYAKNAARHRITSLQSRMRRIEYVREYDRQRGYRPRDPHKEHARKELHNALRRGDIERGACEVCGATPADGHHDDYAKPLDVRWLCKKHHGEQHWKHQGRENA